MKSQMDRDIELEEELEEELSSTAAAIFDTEHYITMMDFAHSGASRHLSIAISRMHLSGVDSIQLTHTLARMLLGRLISLSSCFVQDAALLSNGQFQCAMVPM